VLVQRGDLEGAFALESIIKRKTGEVIVESNYGVVAGKLQQIVEEGVKTFKVFFPSATSSARSSRQR
jgi:hypothetical protein